MPWCVGPLGRDWPRGRVQWAHPRPKLIIGPLDIDTLDAHMSLVVYLFLLFYVSSFILTSHFYASSAIEIRRSA